MKKLTGNTYSIKDFIKSAGGKWNPQDKCWLVPDDKYQECVEKIGAVQNSEKINLQGQLWEDCRLCGGSGPVYMSHGCICGRCAKKGIL